MENETTNNNVETKLCKHCQTEIPKKAKVCPNCRKKQGGKGKWIAIAVVVLVVIAAMAGGGGEEPEPSAVKTDTVAEDAAKSDTKQDAETNEKTEEEIDNHFKAGDVVETQDLKISYISVEEYTSNNEFIQPKEGNVYYRMEFEFENIGDMDQTISSLASWNCYADGYAADQAYIGEDEIDATISPGKKVKGAVYYEVPKDAGEITLEYETNFWSQDKIIFIVK